MIKPRFLVGFTGHRSGVNESIIAPRLREVLQSLCQKAESVGGQAELYAGVAEGGDTLCVELARGIDMPVHLMLPLDGPEFQRDFSSSDAWERTFAQISAARERPGRNSVHVDSGDGKRPDCYFNQGASMLAAVDVLVALWNGQAAMGLGGTEQVMNQAKAMGIPVIRIVLATGEIEQHGDVDNCFREDSIIKEINELSAPFQKVVPTSPELYQKALDQLAVQESGRFRPSLAAVILTYGTAALLGTPVALSVINEATVKGGASFEHFWNECKWICIAAELVLVCGALWMNWRLHDRCRRERCRVACEVVRGLRYSIPVISAFRPIIALRDPEWHRFALSAGLFVQEHSSGLGLVEARDHYICGRLSDTQTEGQIRHYQMTRPAAMMWWKITSAIGFWSAALAPVSVLFALLSHPNTSHVSGLALHLDDGLLALRLVTLMPIALPLMAGFAISLRHVTDTRGKAERSHQMVLRIAAIKRTLSGMQTASTIGLGIQHAENLLLDDLLECQRCLKTSDH